MTQRPIAKKYCEGKLKRISKEKLKVHETISREQISGFWAESALAVYCQGSEGKREAGQGRRTRIGQEFVLGNERSLSRWTRFEEKITVKLGLWRLSPGWCVWLQVSKLVAGWHWLGGGGRTTNPTVALTMAYTYCPVLKHGSRSASELRVFWCKNQQRVMKVNGYQWLQRPCRICRSEFFWRIWAKLILIQPERWWSLLEKGEAWRNSGGGPSGVLTCKLMLILE